MVRLTKIYTRGGDAGETSLGDGSRRSKADIRVQAYGSVDEVNACIGVIRLHTDGAIDRLLSHIQNDLFDLGADLCRPQADEARNPEKANTALRITAAQVKALESACDHYNQELVALDSFILPGGTQAGAYMHLARTVTRRTERLCVLLADAESVNGEAVKYLNRLSDLLFVLSRYCNDKGQKDVLWVPGGNSGDDSGGNRKD